MDTRPSLKVWFCSAIVIMMSRNISKEYFPYNVHFHEGHIYTDTRLGLEGVALLDQPYYDIRESPQRIFS